MFTLASFLPRNLMTTIATGVTERYQRWCRITDETLDMAEAELAQRREFAGIAAAPIVVQAIESDESEPRRRKTK